MRLILASAVLGVAAISLSGCSQPSSNTTPPATITTTQITQSTPPVPSTSSTPVASIKPTTSSTTATSPSPTVTPSVTSSAPVALFLTVSQPADESITGDSQISIKGQTLAGADLSINGDVVTVDSSGNFSQPETLTAGPNVFDITATDDAGNDATTEIVVSYIP